MHWFMPVPSLFAIASWDGPFQQGVERLGEIKKSPVRLGLKIIESWKNSMPT